MKEKIKALIKRADKSLESAKLLVNNRYNDASVSRSYYAMFYATEAVLLTKNLKFSSHKGVISLLGQYFIRTSIFPVELGRDLSKAFDERLTVDYSFNSEITQEIAENAINRGENFIERIKEYLLEEGYELVL
ncbi:MAG: HEPN domain-containing protein [Methanobacteriaceae archaeon]|jgi:uncharacterized protein (UPF0332 family)